ncbi:MAG: triose-phosphate isomerase [Desulfopila sp.]
MQRKPLIAANWKMHTTLASARTLARDVAKTWNGAGDREVLLAPPFTVLHEVASVLSGTDIILAGQNVCWEEQGAYTAEISPTMLKDSGARAAIIGHSERRQLFGEDDPMINKRLRGALNYALLPILCCGETLAERDSGKTYDILETQIRQGLANVTQADIAPVVIAYEPVWAIGTGKTATTEQAQEAHGFLRRLIEKMYEKKIAEQMRILYGGSVKPANVDELMHQTDIDGALVGGAALDAESFGRIINFS